jgi:hypothetical protein
MIGLCPTAAATEVVHLLSVASPDTGVWPDGAGIEDQRPYRRQASGRTLKTRK